MIQRIQSIYLLLILILSSLLFFFPFQTNIIGFSEIKDIQLSLLDTSNTYLFIASVINLIVIINTATTILMYKRRPLQILLCHIISVNIIVLTVFMYIGSSQIEGLPTYKLPYIIPILNIILAQLARYYIKKDEELVKSANRIR
ncbi:MAG: DUF4293 domain-containing protein [Bacteroidia bacterium]|jgi:hypothetical protein|nr:DUF4293 domain-containing protein [Bacteroidia bacterium]